MLDALNITEEEALGLAELAQHDLALARDFSRRAQAAEDGEEASGLARSYHRAARSYRQTLALKARLRRDLAEAAPAPQAPTPTRKSGPAATAHARRIGELRGALLRLVWNEAERPETEGEGDAFDAACRRFTRRRDDVELQVAEARWKPDFREAPLDQFVAGLALRLGFAPEVIARWRDLPDPPQAALDHAFEEIDWRSSA